MFEEAAGISKYRHRKEESERKLQRTEENLVRINDKIAELELQVEPLRKQAETAKKYLVLRDELRALLLAAVILVYAALFQILGYFISTLLAATVILLIFRVKKIWAYPVVYAAAVAIWAGFTFLLSVRLP